MIENLQKTVDEKQAKIDELRKACEIKEVSGLHFEIFKNLNEYFQFVSLLDLVLVGNCKEAQFYHKFG